MAGLDKVDLAILRLLQQDGRMSNASLSAQLALSETPCWRRIKRLQQEGYIEGYQANLNRRKLGLGVMAFVQITCTRHDADSTREFEAIVLSSPQILSCHNTTGSADYLLQVVATDLDGLSEFIEKTLRQLPGVSAIHSNLSLRELKSSGRLPLQSV